jgi:hypothetical protein
MGLWDTVEDVGGAIGGAIESGVDTVGDAAEATVDYVTDTAENVADAVADAADVVAGAIADAVGESIEFLEETAETIGEAITTAIEDAAEWIKSAAIDVANWIADAASDTWTWVKNAAEDVWDALESAGAWIAEAADKAWEWIKSAWEDFKEFLVKAIWVITHIDDILYGIIVGGICLLLGLDEKDYPLLRQIYDGVPALRDKLKVKKMPSSLEYVVFSDFHMFQGGSDLDKFRILENDKLYMSVLSKYADKKYVLIENGDIEDLWMREPSLGGALIDQTFDCVGGPFGEVLDEVYEGSVRKRQLGGIIANNVHVYGWIRDLFHDKGRFIRTVGNHDQQMRDGELLDGIRTVYDGVDIYDYVFIGVHSHGIPIGGPDVIIGHGHQFDAWNTRTCAKMAGEAITETVSGVSRWAASTKSHGYWQSRLDGKGFDNELSDLTFTTFFFEQQSVDEPELRDLLEEAFEDAPKQPHLVLGHTHTPRYRAADEDGRVFANYTNTGTAGRFDDLIWCVEIVKGEPSLHAWHWENGKPRDRLMAVGSNGKLVPVT